MTFFITVYSTTFKQNLKPRTHPYCNAANTQFQSSLTSSYKWSIHRETPLPVSASKRGPKSFNLQPRTQNFGSESTYSAVTWYYLLGEIPQYLLKWSKTNKQTNSSKQHFYLIFIIFIPTFIPTYTAPLRNRGRARLEVSPRLKECKPKIGFLLKALTGLKMFGRLFHHFHSTQTRLKHTPYHLTVKYMPYMITIL